MATKDLDTTDIKRQELLEDMTKCSICFEFFTDPKALPCIHTFCMKCIQDTGLSTNKRPGDEMPCPMCTQLFKIPPEGFQGLPKNFSIENLVAVSRVAAMSEVNVSAVTTTTALCAVCFKESKEEEGRETPTAHIYCVDCRSTLCNDCYSDHRKCKAIKNHKFMEIDVQGGGQTGMMNQSPKACALHRHRVLDVFCSDCKVTVCDICFGDDHKNHESSDVDFKKQIELTTEAITECLSMAQKKQAELSGAKEALLEAVAKAECDVASRQDELKQLIDKDAASLLQELYSTKQSKLKEIQMAADDVNECVLSLQTCQSSDGSDGNIYSTASDSWVRTKELQQECQAVTEREIQTFDLRFRKSDLEELLEESSNNNLVGEIKGFEEPEEDQAAVDELNNTTEICGGYTTFVGEAQKPERHSESTDGFEPNTEQERKSYGGVDLYIKNLDFEIDVEQLSKKFSAFGIVTSASVKCKNGRSTGVGFVSLSTPEEAGRAIAEMHDRILGSKHLYVQHKHKAERKAYPDAPKRSKLREQGPVDQRYPQTASNYIEGAQPSYAPSFQQVRPPGPRWPQPQVGIMPGMSEEQEFRELRPRAQHHRKSHSTRRGRRTADAHQYQKHNSTP